jgi:hypothetical protein
VRDPEGTKHPLDLYVETCGGVTPITKSATMDGTGIVVDIGANPPLLTLKDGTQITLSRSSDYLYVSGTAQEDPNGNLLSLSTDTMGRNLVTTTQGSGYTLYSVTDSNGATQTYRIDWTGIRPAIGSGARPRSSRRSLSGVSADLFSDGRGHSSQCAPVHGQSRV